MKHVIKGLFSIALLCSMTVNAADSFGRSYFLGTSTGTIAGGGLIEHAGRAHRNDQDKMYACFSSHTEINKTGDAAGLGKYLSLKDSDTFVVGPLATSSNDTDVFGLHLLIAEDRKATVTLAPKATTITSNLNLYVGLDEFLEGLYLDVTLPLVYNKREVVINETENTARGDANFATDTFLNGTAHAAVYNNFKEAMVGDKTIAGAIGVAANNMQYGQINGSQDTFKVGNASIALGYNFINQENCHLGVAAQALLNGNGASDAKYMFEPSVGTGGYHGFGARLDGHYRVYEKDDADISLHLRADIHHLFKKTQKRTYDFTAQHGVWSRYMLYKTYASVGGNPTANSIIHGVNFSTLDAKIGINAMYDVNLMARYSTGAMAFDLGYSLHGQSKEEHKEWVTADWTLIYGAFGSVGEGDLTTAEIAKTAVDSDISGQTVANGTVSAVTNTAANNVQRAKLDVNSGLNPSALAHRVFGNFSYRWEDNEWEPCLGVGGGYQMASGNKEFRQWGVHFHGGVSF